MNRALVVFLPLFIAGCGLSPVLEVAYYGLQGISLATSGRSVGDHAISAMLDKDCAMFRLVKGEAVCREPKEGEVPVSVTIARALKEDASAPQGVADADGPEFGEDTERAEQTIAAAASADPMMVPRSMSDDVPALAGIAVVETATPTRTAAFSKPLPRQVAAVVDVRPLSAPETAAPGRQRTGWEVTVAVAKRPDMVPGASVLVLGSYLTRLRARRAARQWPSIATTVVSARIGGKTYYRVVTRPVGSAGIADERARLKSHGVPETWTAKVCPAGTSRPQCVVLPSGI